MRNSMGYIKKHQGGPGRRPAQEALAKFINDLVERGEGFPNYVEMAKHMGWANANSARNALEKCGDLLTEKARREAVGRYLLKFSRPRNAKTPPPLSR